MPVRTRTRTDTGFGGFAPNPRFTSGIDLPPTGEYDAPVSPSPSSTFPARGGITIYPGGGRPSGTHVTPRTGGSTFNTGTLTPDPSGAGLTPSGLTGETLRSLPNARWTPDTQGGMFADRSGASGGLEMAEPTIASGGGRPPMFTSDPNDDWLGNPTQTARSDGLPTEPGMSDQPVLFEPNNNEWTTSPGDRRFLPSPQSPSSRQSQYVGQPQSISGFGGNLTLGQLLFTPLSSLGFGEGRGGAGAGTVTYADQSHTTPAIEADPVTGWSPTPTEAANADATFAEAERRGQQETGSGSTRPSADPASRFGNVNSPSGQAVYLDPSGSWRPVSGAPQNVRWDPANPHNSNYQASQTTRAFLLAGGYHGNPNNMSSAAMEGRSLTDEEGAPRQMGPMYSRNANTLQQTAQQMAGPVPSTRDPNFKQLFDAWNKKVADAYRQLKGG